MIPDSVKWIGYSAFLAVKISKGDSFQKLEGIDSEAFQNCKI